MQPRPLEPRELDHLATVWHTAWHEAHAALLPEMVVRARTRESLRDRLAAAIGDVRVIGPPGAPLGFHHVRADELYQFYVAAAARGTGLAAILLADAEQRIARAGARSAWLACAIGNDRAARFYEKNGWRRVRVEPITHLVPDGEVTFDVWRYEKELAANP